MAEKNNIQKDEKIGLGVAGFTLCLLGFVLSWTLIIGIPLLIVGLILSLSQNRENKTGLATAGRIIGYVGLFLSLIFFVFFFVDLETVFDSEDGEVYVQTREEVEVYNPEGNIEQTQTREEEEVKFYYPNGNLEQTQTGKFNEYGLVDGETKFYDRNGNLIQTQTK